jgi:NAD(P)-dependent dehydrogenase (short-subunit alcohol dehydrogenase family)
MTRAVLPVLRAHGGGAIVQMSSMSVPGDDKDSQFFANRAFVLT